MNFIKPMLCKEEKDLTRFDSVNGYCDWVCQDKIDGCRAIVQFHDGKVEIQGRNREITHRYPDLVAKLPNSVDCIVDAEIITQDDVFNHLQSREQNNNPFKIEMVAKLFPAKLMVFDIIELKGNSLRDVPFIQRHYLLTENVKENDVLHILPLYDDIKKRFQWAKDNKKEGVIVKKKSLRYQDGKRSAQQLKVKNWKEAIVTFDRYELNNAGGTLENAEGTRVLVAGEQFAGVKKQIDDTGKVQLEIQYLEMTKTGKYRMPTCKSVVS